MGAMRAVKWVLIGITVFGLGYLGWVRLMAWGRHLEETSDAGVVYDYHATKNPGTDLRPLCEKAGISWPPARLRLVALKEEEVLEVWVGGETGAFKRLITYAITASSGDLGPKQKEGDNQVPEGIYRLTTLNPQSRFHLSIKVDYPNETDIAHASVARNRMGGDIYIHGGAATIGCLPIGNEAIERLYDLASLVPLGKRDILICPVDFRVRPGFGIEGEDKWVEEMYMELERALSELPLGEQRKGT